LVAIEPECPRFESIKPLLLPSVVTGSFAPHVGRSDQIPRFLKADIVADDAKGRYAP
jgi:hypothetical protein